MTTKTTDITIRSRTIRTDEMGRICLSDIYKSGTYGRHSTPNDWWRIYTVQSLAKALLAKSPGNARSLADLYKSKLGPGGGVYAHPILACAYAGYLSPELEVEVREVWLRYRAGDPTLADEVLEKASPEAAPHHEPLRGGAADENTDRDVLSRGRKVRPVARKQNRPGPPERAGAVTSRNVVERLLNHLAPSRIASAPRAEAPPAPWKYQSSIAYLAT